MTLTADVAGGHFTGHMSFKASEDGLTARAKLALTQRRCGGLAGLGRAAGGDRLARSHPANLRAPA